MSGIRAAAVVLLGCVLIVSGCDRKPRPKEAMPAAERTAQERVAGLRRSTAAMAETAARMPGRTDPEDRQLTAKAFSETAAALVQLAGPGSGGAMRIQLRTIASARSQLLHPPAEVAVEPATDSGLRAVYNALVDLRNSGFPDNLEVTRQVADVGQRLPELDRVRGPLHSLVVAEVFSSVSQAAGKMADVMAARISPPLSAAPAPPGR